VNFMKKVKHLGIVVSDLDKAMESWSLAGVARFNMFNMSTSQKTCGQVFKNGKLTEIEAKVANFELGDLQIELIQPLDDKNVYADFIKECGPGLHHICPDLGETSYEEAEKLMKKSYGEPVFNGTGVVMKFVYFDARKQLGSFIEIAAKKAQR
jgi:methylmalonyl-CoA/ethylmalonyl-CoA epimerase